MILSAGAALLKLPLLGGETFSENHEIAEFLGGSSKFPPFFFLSRGHWGVLSGFSTSFFNQNLRNYGNHFIILDSLLSSSFENDLPLQRVLAPPPHPTADWRRIFR